VAQPFFYHTPSPWGVPPSTITQPVSKLVKAVFFMHTVSTSCVNFALLNKSRIKENPPAATKIYHFINPLIRMSAKNNVQQLLSNILIISQSNLKIPEATRDDPIFQRFGCPPILAEDEEDEGMWYVVNRAMDSLFGVENCKENIRRGKYGIEAALEYLKIARQHPSWNADELLIPKLERIYKCFEGKIFFFYRCTLQALIL
jgi:hypothetical protein